MYSTLFVIALALVAPANVEGAPEWKSDYATALKDAAAAGKPLAIFIGSGNNGWQRVSDTGTLDAQALKLLRERYVCLYADTANAAGRDLAAALGNTVQRGVVLSDKHAKYQIFKHAGALEAPQLVLALEQHVAYEVPSQVIQRTSYYGPTGGSPVMTGGFGGACRG